VAGRGDHSSLRLGPTALAHHAAAVTAVVWAGRGEASDGNYQNEAAATNSLDATATSVQAGLGAQNFDNTATATDCDNAFAGIGIGISGESDPPDGGNPWPSPGG
jgi:hypothetical protein